MISMEIQLQKHKNVRKSALIKINLLKYMWWKIGKNIILQMKMKENPAHLVIV